LHVGSITASSRRVRKEKWAFRAAQLFFLDARPSALCLLNYFLRVAREGFVAGSVTYERVAFAKASAPWSWDDDAAQQRSLCAIEFAEQSATIEQSSCAYHADFANRFVGGGALENDFNMEEILFVVKPELIVAMALCSFLHDEEALRVRGALQYSRYSGYASTFAFVGDADSPLCDTQTTVCAMDALQGAKMIQFNEPMVRRDLDKARVAFDGASTIATGNWGAGAFGNDHQLKFFQQVQ
jgi:poly(ADP-ribose) glycohydrolase